LSKKKTRSQIAARPPSAKRPLEAVAASGAMVSRRNSGPSAR